MSQSEKSAYFQALKASGLEFEKPYAQYTTVELKQAYERLEAAGAAKPLEPPLPETEDVFVAPSAGPDLPDPSFFGFASPEPEPEPDQRNYASPPPMPAAPMAAMDPNELAGQRMNSKDLEEPIRTDPDGKVWLQEEVRKPAYPKPRGRRVLKYMDPGVEQRTVRAGDYQETFEISGDPANARPAEVKITLPSYQVGIYRDPRFPFKVVCYNSEEGFDLDEVRTYYGGRELVPPSVKLKYVSNVLCYDIISVVRAIEEEYRTRVLGQRA